VIEVAATGVYPVRVDASLDAPLSRWLWLVKWLLLIPHFIVLAFLWLTFVVLSAVAFFAILFTGRYPRPVFKFNVGVLRWTWRVQYYAAGAFGTDRYPPFTLADDPSYPAHLEVEYPRRLSRGLVLVKWWLLAIPHYIIVAVFTGGGLWVAWQTGNDTRWNWPGLIAILAVVAAVVLLFTGRYPRQIFDFVLGMNRWVLRVAAYAGMMTDAYPPFRLDMGGHDPATVALPPPPPPGQGPAGTAEQPGQPDGPGQAFVGGEGTTPASAAGGSQAGPQTGTAGPAGAAPGGQPTGWTAGRVAAVVAGSVLVLCSLGLLGAGGAALWADTAARQGGYVDLGSATYRTGGYAVASDTVELHAAGGGWDAARALFGTVRIRATSATGAPVFIGIAPAGAASTYLAGVAHATISGPAGTSGWYTRQGGTAPAAAPSRAAIWDTRATGPGTQAVVWPVRSGDWTVVAMNANGSAPVSVHVNVAATLPALPWIAGGLLAGGIIILAAGVILLVIPIVRASRQPAAPPR
jgi:hypothetical protein